MNDNLSCNCCFFYQAHFQFGCSFRGVNPHSYLVEQCQLGMEMPDEGVCEEFKKIDYGGYKGRNNGGKVMDKQLAIRNMIDGCTTKLHHLNNELTELEDRLVEIHYMMKEQEYHCNCCKKEDDE